MAVPLVVIDEAASFRHHLGYLIDEVITPTLIDYDGTIALIGTPSASCNGPFFDATTKSTQFSVHQWTILDNPHIPHAKRWLDTYRAQKGWPEDNPIYLREWCGKWVRSEDSLIYRILESNVVDSLPLKEPNYVFGIDLGYEDSNAIAVIAFDYGSPHLYVVDEFKKSGQTISEFAEILISMKNKYNPIKMVADTGGLGKSIVMEMNQRFQLQMKAAEKSQKFSNVEILSSDIKNGFVKFIKQTTQKMRRELEALQWDADHPMKIDDRSEDHLHDALLYASRESKHYTYEPKVETLMTPQESINEFWEKKEQEILEDSQKTWWDNI